MSFLRQVETFLRDPDIQERQAQQPRGLSLVWLYYLQFRSVLNCWFIELCTTSWRIWYLLISMGLWRTDRRWWTCWSIRFFCAEFNWKRMAGGFRLHRLFEGFWSSTPSTVTGGDVCGYRTRSMFMAKVLFNRENSKDKNRRICFQGYEGDIGCPTGESSRTIVFHLVMNIGDFRLNPCAVLRRWYEAVSSRQGFSGLYENSVWSEQTVQVVREKFIIS
jgi:hypothetical protein